MRKPKLLIIGHARHGKDTVAEMIAKQMGLTFKSSSIFVGEKCVWPTWGCERYETFDAMFADRVTEENRIVWGGLISAYNTPVQSRTAEEMLVDHDMYVGMRRHKEWQACMDADLFDYVIWVDACNRLPKENVLSNEMTSSHASLYIDNNGPESHLQIAVDSLHKRLHFEGYDVNYVDHVEALTAESNDDEFEQPYLEETRPTWYDKPEHAVTVLDHGFFEVKEVMGSDEVIAGSARMSYGRGTKKVNNDPGLINYLVKNHHTSPLEMGEIRFHMRLPIFVMRQLVRQRTANLNEYSGRYSEMVRLFYTPEVDQIKHQGTGNKQMSGNTLPSLQAELAQNVIKRSANASFDDYEELLNELDVSRETARIVLPLNTYTEVVWKLDVSNLMKFLYLRDDDHAQWEIREYAKLIGEAVEHYFPAVHASYLKVRSSTTLSKDQITALVTGDCSSLSNSEAKQVYDLRVLSGN